ncbi:hypothetical protein GGR53DRAFT_391309 [Hypoxylon sp. FL1150]|nr:hypothetical protein GGR53DRAFT_391309 [Hypoxylon sp. FL1150]
MRTFFSFLSICRSDEPNCLARLLVLLQPVASSSSFDRRSKGTRWEGRTTKTTDEPRSNMSTAGIGRGRGGNEGGPAFGLPPS